MQDPDIPPEVGREKQAATRTPSAESWWRPNGRDRHQHSGIYTAPMDHSYRATLGGTMAPDRAGMRPGFAPSYAPVDPEPLPQGEDANSRIFAFVDDLFFRRKSRRRRAS